MRVCPEIQKTGNIRTDKGRYRQDTENVVRAEESKYNRSRSVSGSYTYVGGDTAAFERSPVHGIFERQKFADDIRQARKLEIQVWKQAFLVQRILC